MREVLAGMCLMLVQRAPEHAGGLEGFVRDWALGNAGIDVFAQKDMFVWNLEHCCTQTG